MSEVKQTCFHEAAHAVIDKLHECLIERIEIGSVDLGNGKTRLGRTSATPTTLLSAVELAIMAASGCAWDIESKALNGEEAFAGAEDDLLGLIEQLSHEFEERVIIALFIEGIENARAMFNERGVRSAIEAVGLALVEGLIDGMKTMQGDEFLEIVRAYLE